MKLKVITPYKGPFEYINFRGFAKGSILPFVCYVDGCEGKFGSPEGLGHHFEHQHPKIHKTGIVCHRCLSYFDNQAKLKAHKCVMEGFAHYRELLAFETAKASEAEKAARALVDKAKEAENARVAAEAAHKAALNAYDDASCDEAIAEEEADKVRGEAEVFVLTFSRRSQVRKMPTRPPKPKKMSRRKFKISKRRPKLPIRQRGKLTF
ncbi:hypothetical protein CASFOL_026728 [Castilleja foliolosa]|uniref:C2H2-type domain-containing protein n=1 Tax=Castilleja foliolosa TaxID=1961234 RepID=A0ABD3CJK1_9LAMI